MNTKKIVLPILVALCMTTKAQAVSVPSVRHNELLALKEKRVQELEKAEQNITTLNKQLEDIKTNKEKEKDKARKKAKKVEKVTRGGINRGTFTITAYDDTPASQGKWVGTTATGFSLTGHTRESAMCIAVDPKVIPLRSKVLLEFDDEYAHFNGVYTAYDTGGAIKGNIIDLFMGGQGVAQQVRKFGRRKVKVTILE